MRPGGVGTRHLLSAGPSPQWDPAVSPQGRMLAFRGYYGLGDGAYALYVVGTDGCTVRRLTGSIAGNPTWSPGGKRIAGAEENASPAWSPQGRRIAFVRYRSGRGQIWVMGADSATLLHKDARASDETPAWSHDGKRLAFVAQVGQRSRIELMRADGSNARTLRSRGNPWNPVWLPRDAGIAFLAGWTNGQEGLFVMRPDGTHVHRVALLQAEEFTWVGARLPTRRC